MGNKKYIWIIIAILIFLGILVFVYKLYRDLSKIDEVMQPITNSIPLYFEDVNQTIYIKTKVWGLMGDHSCIFISDKDDNYSIENKDILFENTILYYKIQYPDSLLIFLPSKSYSEERNINKILGDIKIIITEYKASKNEKYKKDYEKMGLKKIEANP
ncbi:MAG: hypothetical protein ACLVKO_08175 [Dysgonomonas sp.]